MQQTEVIYCLLLREASKRSSKAKIGWLPWAHVAHRLVVQFILFFLFLNLERVFAG